MGVCDVDCDNVLQIVQVTLILHILYFCRNEIFDLSVEAWSVSLFTLRKYEHAH